MTPEERAERMDAVAAVVLGPAPTTPQPTVMGEIIVTGMRRASSLALVSILGDEQARAYVDRLMR